MGDHSSYHPPSFEQFSLSRNFEFTKRKFKEAYEIKTQNDREVDLASKLMMERLDKLNLDDLSPDWDGSFEKTSK